MIESSTITTSWDFLKKLKKSFVRNWCQCHRNYYMRKVTKRIKQIKIHRHFVIFIKSQCVLDSGSGIISESLVKNLNVVKCETKCIQWLYCSYSHFSSETWRTRTPSPPQIQLGCYPVKLGDPAQVRYECQIQNQRRLSIVTEPPQLHHTKMSIHLRCQRRKNIKAIVSLIPGHFVIGSLHSYSCVFWASDPTSVSIIPVLCRKKSKMRWALVPTNFHNCMRGIRGPMSFYP